MFKIQADRHGDLHYVRIYSGELKANSRVYNPGKDKKENVPQLWRIQADRREQVERSRPATSSASSACATRSPATRSATPQEPILLESIAFPETVISMAIEPETSTERKKLADVLEMMKRQDPTFRARENEETGQTLDQRHGRAAPGGHQAPAAARLPAQRPRPQAAGELPRDDPAGGRGHRRMPPQRGRPDRSWPGSRSAWSRSGNVPSRSSSGRRGGALPEPYLAAAVEVLSEQGEGGGTLGFPLMHVKITVLGGEVHETESNELAFRLAAGDAFDKGLREAGIVLLEPIMRMEVTVPEEHLGDIMGDLQQRRAIITRTHARGRNTVIEAQAPLANLFGYSSAMRGLSQGRATCTMEPPCLRPRPAGGAGELYVG